MPSRSRVDTGRYGHPVYGSNDLSGTRRRAIGTTGTTGTVNGGRAHTWRPEEQTRLGAALNNCHVCPCLKHRHRVIRAYIEVPVGTGERSSGNAQSRGVKEDDMRV